MRSRLPSIPACPLLLIESPVTYPKSGRAENPEQFDLELTGPKRDNAFPPALLGTFMTDPACAAAFDLPVAETLVPPVTEQYAPADWVLERRADGAVLVRVPSLFRGDRTLPEAVFSFRLGDPQYAYWEGELLRRSGR